MILESGSVKLRCALGLGAYGSRPFGGRRGFLPCAASSARRPAPRPAPPAPHTPLASPVPAPARPAPPTPPQPLHEHPPQRLQMAGPEASDRTVIRMLIRAQHPHRHITVGRPLQLARGDDAVRVAVDEQLS